ncbi:MAG: hypothetical protein AB1488_01835 [Nitrospirota bacterium]
MKILYILKSEPDEIIKKIIEYHSTNKNHTVKIIELYKENTGYDELIDLIFEYDKVISW